MRSSYHAKFANTFLFNIRLFLFIQMHVNSAILHGDVSQFTKILYIDMDLYILLYKYKYQNSTHTNLLLIQEYNPTYLV